jgi:hypothetical protein
MDEFVINTLSVVICRHSRDKWLFARAFWNVFYVFFSFDVGCCHWIVSRGDGTAEVPYVFGNFLFFGNNIYVKIIITRNVVISV